jgi:NADH dehydrogenase [ubiquinone] 1 alpha subcomplex assembly factor 5
VEGSERCGTYRMVADEEAKMPFPDGTFDLVISSVALHWVNELPALFSEVKRVLKPDGCFIFAMIGGTTLPELRASMVLAETEREGGVSPHVGPFVELSDVGGLVSGAGFTLPTIDVDTIKIAFPNAMLLMEHLQRMGESNACINRRPRTAADTFLASACLYDEMFKLETDEGLEEDNVEASVQVIYSIGWSPHESQQQPKKRGTATHRVGDIVEQTKASDETKS